MNVAIFGYGVDIYYLVQKKNQFTLVLINVTVFPFLNPMFSLFSNIFLIHILCVLCLENVFIRVYDDLTCIELFSCVYPFV